MRLELKKIQRELSITTIYVTHDQAEALALSHEIAVMNEGRIVQIGSPRSIYEKPRDRFVAEFIGSGNLIDAEVLGPEADGIWRVRSKLGDLSAFSESPLSPGTKVTVSVRPENVEITEGEPAGVGNHFQAVIEAKIFQGDFSEFQLRANGEVLLARTHPSLRTPVGNSIFVRLAPEHCFLIAG
jgi:iron(III) transport system ATP-binding protein